MKEGILEVLLVSASGLKHTNLIGKPSYFVIIECGAQVKTSKCSTVTEFSAAAKHEKISWNEKFSFDFQMSKWVNINHLKLRIMDEEYFTDGGFVGETIVYLEGIKMEGDDKGVIELTPTPYNVVLEDDSYKGEIKIGLKFITNEVGQKKRGEFIAEEKEGSSLCKTIRKLWNISLCRLLSFYRKRNSDHKQKI